MRLRFALFIAICGTTLCGTAQTEWSLEQCMAYALDHNLNIALNDVGVEQADNALRQSRLARLPNLNASSNYGLSWGRFTNPDNLTVDASLSQTNSYNISSSLPVFQGFGLMRSIRVAEDQLSLAQMDVRAAEDQVRLNVLSAYLQVLLALEDRNRRESQVELSRDNLSNSQRLAAAGVIPEGNLRELEAQVATDELGVIQSENNIALSYLQLRLVMQAEPDLDFTVSVPDKDQLSSWLVEETWDADAVFAHAAANLPAFSGNALAEQIARNNIAVAKSDLYPSVGLSGGANTSWFTEKSVSDFLPSYGQQLDNNFGQFVGVGLNIPIFNNGIVRTNIRNAELNLERQVINNELELNTLRQTIEQAIADARNAASSYRAAQKVVDARQLALDFADKRFQAGQSPSFELSNARNLLAASEVDLLTAKYNFILASKTLDFYQGKNVFW